MPSVRNEESQMMIELKGVGRTYRRPAGDTVRAMDDVSLAIDRGEFVALVGASGSGKSTLMNVLGLLDQPDDGSYLLDGQDVARIALDEQARLRSEHIGFVFQAFHLLPRMSALENVELPLLYSQRPVIDGLGLRALEAVGLADRARHHSSELSGGQQQRVAIARALVNDPDLLLADEPTGNLDVRAAGEILDIFHALNRAGRTIVLVTHDAGIAAHCSRVARLDGGRIVSDSGSARATGISREDA
jgi:putative ABC transport system ATP-binding protein